MAIQTPWDLASTAQLPNTVEWWLLSEPPNTPVEFEDMESLRIPGLVVLAYYGVPLLDSSGQACWNGFSLLARSDGTVPGYPKQWGAVGLVDTEGNGTILGWWRASSPNTLLGPSDQVQVSGYITATRYAPANG